MDKNLSLLLTCLLFMVTLLSGCERKSAVYLSAEGKPYSDAKVIIDGKTIGHLVQMVIEPGGDMFIDGRRIGSSDRITTVRTEKQYWGSMDKMRLKPGRHQIELMAQNGEKTEIDALVFPGENYVLYSPEKGKLLWNNKEYQVVRGYPIIMENQHQGLPER